MPHINETDIDEDGNARTVVDRAILARTTGYAQETIRKRCKPLRYDPDTGRALYDRDVVLAELADAGVVPRPETRGPRPPAWKKSRRAG